MGEEAAAGVGEEAAAGVGEGAAAGVSEGAAAGVGEGAAADGVEAGDEGAAADGVEAGDGEAAADGVEAGDGEAAADVEAGDGGAAAGVDDEAAAGVRLQLAWMMRLQLAWMKRLQLAWMMRLQLAWMLRLQLAWKPETEALQVAAWKPETEALLQLAWKPETEALQAAAWGPETEALQAAPWEPETEALPAGQIPRTLQRRQETKAGAANLTVTLEAQGPGLQAAQGPGLRVKLGGLETELQVTLEALETELSVALETELSVALETELSVALETELSVALETELSVALETELRVSEQMTLGAGLLEAGQLSELLEAGEDGHFIPDNQHPSFRNRVDLQDRKMKDGDVSLILKDVTINETGTYECRVLREETLRWRSVSFIYLYVDPPDPTIITAESGQDVTLTCRAPNNNFKGVTWSRIDLLPECVLMYQDGHFDPDNQHPSFKNRVDLQDRQMKDGDVSLILKDVTINDTGTYECRVSREEVWAFSFILLVVVPPDPTIITAESGQDVTLTCRVQNIDNIVVVAWFRADLADESRAPNKNITAVEWSRVGLGYGYVFLDWDSHFPKANQHPSNPSDRMDLQDGQKEDGEVCLILKDVTINDTGTYVFIALMPETLSWKSINSINLRVVVPPDPKTIKAESGQDVILTCRAPNNRITTVKWSRADFTSSCVFLYQDGDFIPDEQHPSFKNRVDLQDRQMKDGDVSLILKDVTINESGTYMCRVRMEEPRIERPHLELISIIHLTVVAPPDPKTIKAESGQDVILTCRAPNNRITTVKWSRADFTSSCVFLYQDGDFIPDEQHPSFKNRVDLQDRQMKDGDVSLILKDVTINETGTYMCRVRMEEPRIERPHLELISIIHLTVVAPPDPKTIKAESGQDVILTCRAPNNRITTVKWSRADFTSSCVFLYQDGDFIPDEQHPSFKNRVDLQDRQMKDGDVSLILKDVTINETGTYMCRVRMEEPRIERPHLELISIIHLTVVAPPDPKTIKAESGQDVILTCRAPNNRITTVKWSRADFTSSCVFLYQDGDFIPDEQHPSFKNRVDLQDRQMKDGDVSLILKDVTINESGTYMCRVRMEEPRIERPHLELISIIHLTVVAPPDPKTIKAESGQDVILTCRAPNNRITTVKWSRADFTSSCVFLYQDGDFIPDEQHPSFKNRVDLQDRQMKDGDVSLILKDVTINESGTYMCRVRMEEPRIERPHLELISIIHLTVVAPPGE
ncbi:unnamed protein product [Oreochromis niloticus]|nr:unnamed protein product [Mustela putorius furo]